MRVTAFTRSALKVRRDLRDRPKEGWLRAGEPRWQLNRGSEWRDVIVDVRISACGKGLWIKTAREDASAGEARPSLSGREGEK